MEKRTILSVDDDSFYTDLYSTILEPKGFDVVIAQAPRDGFEAAINAKPDLILLDVMMPEQGDFRDGFDLLDRLRKDERTAHTPIIMISALGSVDDVKHGMDLGASIYLAKHETVPEKLVAEINRLIAKQDEKTA